MLTISIQLPSSVGDEDLAQALIESLRGLVKINARWYLAEWEAGRDPPCCASCAKVRYRPDALGVHTPLLSAPVLYTRGIGSCGSIAAAHSSHKVAESIKDGMSMDEAVARYDIRLRKQPVPAGDTSAAARKINLHAVCWDDGKIVDPTQGMPR